MLQLHHKQVLVVGLARSGVAAANLLLSQGAHVHVTDHRKPGDSFRDDLKQKLQGEVETTLGRHRAADFLQADLIILSPGVPPDMDPVRRAQSAGVPVLAEVELAFHFLSGPIIGVTGTNGKTTTTTLIGKMFQDAHAPVAVAGNIGTPLTEIALLGPGRGTTLVVELSSFQLEGIQDFRAHIALILNLTPDHLDRHGSLQSYARAKQRILLNQTREDWAVLNADDALSSGMRSEVAGSVCLFSRRPLPEGVCVEAGQIVIRQKGETASVMLASEVAMKGAHNLENVLAATCAAHLSGLSLGAVRRTIQNFQGVEHRLERVAVHDGVTYYNDSKATNVESAKRALQAFSNPVVLIMGGRDKGGDFEQLADLMKERVRRLILIGEAAGKITCAVGSSAVVSEAADLQEAVVRASQAASTGDTVLLAPGCASFDMFDDYEHRGREFKESVARYIHHRESGN